MIPEPVKKFVGRAGTGKERNLSVFLLISDPCEPDQEKYYIVN